MRKMLLSLLLLLSLATFSADFSNNGYQKVKKFNPLRAYSVGDVVNDFNFTTTLPGGGTEEVSIHGLIDSQKAIIIFFGHYGCGGCETAAPQLNTSWNDTYQAGGHSYFVSSTDWSNSNSQDYPFDATMENSHYNEFGNGYVPFFAVIGADYKLFYGDNNLGGAMTALDAAIQSVIDNGPYVTPGHSITTQVLNIGDSQNVDITDLFSTANASGLTVTMTNSNTASLTATLSGNAITLTGVAAGDATITLTATDNAKSGSIDYNFDVQVKDDNAPEQWLEYGVNYTTDNAIGVGTAPWSGAIDWDLGSENNYTISKIETGMNNAETITWKVCEFTTEPQQDAVIGDLTGTFALPAAQMSEIAITSTQKITGHVSFIIESAGNYMFTDNTISLPVGDWAYTSGKGWDHLSDFDFPYVWAIRAYVIKENAIHTVLPGSTTLSQNYPNPFNPTTSINFFNNMSGNVNLTVFNANGETVKTLINSKMEAGNHSVDFNASNLISGVYYYTLKTPTKSLTKKMVLVK